MNYAAISDSVTTDPLNPPTECPQCHVTARVDDGACLSCLLQVGAQEDEPCDRTHFESALAEIDIRDSDWRLGNYQILEEIGRGGMGVIYRARQRHSRRIVALKRILNYHSDSGDTLERFRREAEAAASLEHPNILPIFEVGESEGLPFFTMKFASGGSLQRSAAALSADPRGCVRLLAKVTRGVAYAHGQGILHRDLKPGNVLLDSHGEPMVSDFGLAKWIDAKSDFTRSLAIFGTPGFIAPEQAQGPGSELTAAADIYSLGAILFNLLTGRSPFLGDNALSVIRQAADKEAPKLRSLMPNADRDLETICARCLERDPLLRYHSAGDLAEDLERWLDGRPILARPVSLFTATWRWARRNRILACSVAAAVIFGGLALVRQLQSSALQNSVRAQALAANSIAVLPFLNLDTGEPDDMTASGMISLLQARVSPQTPLGLSDGSKANRLSAGTGNARDLRQTGELLNSRLLVTGSTRTKDDQRIVSIRIIEAATARIVWKKRTVGAVGENLTDRIAPEFTTAILGILGSDNSAGTPEKLDPQDPRARELVASAKSLMYRMTLGDFDRSLECLRRALEIEPESAVANSYYAIAVAGRTHLSPDDALLVEAEWVAKHAVELAPGMSVSHRALAGVLYQEQKLSAAAEEQMRAIEEEGAEDRSAALIGLISLRLGDPVRGLTWLELARHWESSPGELDSCFGDYWTMLQDDARAEASYRRHMELRPDLPDGWIGLCHLRLLQRNIVEARAIFNANISKFTSYNNSNHEPALLAAQVEFYSGNYREADRLYSEIGTKSLADSKVFFGAISCDSASGRSRQLLGDPEGEAILNRHLQKQIQRELTNEDPAFLVDLAAVEASLGHTEAAFARLDAAYAKGWLDARTLELDPRFEPISGDPRFTSYVTAVRERVQKLQAKLQILHPR
jgi:serine/threonine protein kinase/tetratricopeptide (TPR) repeat protein